VVESSAEQAEPEMLPFEQVSDAPVPASADIQTRFADLSGCGAARTCPDCTANLACMW
jgi:hypothetical protein